MKALHRVSLARQNHPLYNMADQANNLPNDCSICRQQSNTGPNTEFSIRAPCNHVFGARCLFKWLTDHATCPECRGDLDRDLLFSDRGISISLSKAPDADGVETLLRVVMPLGNQHKCFYIANVP